MFWHQADGFVLQRGTEVWWRRGGDRWEAAKHRPKYRLPRGSALEHTQSAFWGGCVCACVRVWASSPAMLPGSERSPIAVLVAPDRRWSCEAFHGSHICKNIHTHKNTMSQAFQHLYSFHLTSILISWPTVQLLPFILLALALLWSVIWLSKHNDLASWGNELWVTPACISQAHLPGVCLETGFIHHTRTHTRFTLCYISVTHTQHRCLEKIYRCFPYQRDRKSFLCHWAQGSRRATDGSFLLTDTHRSDWKRTAIYRPEG